MHPVISVVAPVFALIAIGYGAGRLRWLSDASSKGLAEFTFNLAIPALLFRTMATTQLPDASPWALWGAYFLAAFAVWALAAVLAVAWLRRTPEEAVSISMSASFGNIVMIGMPLSLNLYGEAAAAHAAIIVSLHSPLLWTMAALHLAISRNDAARSYRSIARGLIDELSRNVIILAIVAGTLWRFTGLGLHPLADTVVALVGQAGIPCALISLGLSLVGFRIAGQVPTLSLILCLKILMMPLAAWLIAYHLIGLPPLAVGIVTILAGMPTGANAYLFASRNGLAQYSASGAVALGTIVSAVTAALIIYGLR